jgi:hypothetical protein
MFNKIFSLFSKVNSGISRANSMQSTVNSVMYQKDNISSASSKGKGYMLIFVVILAVAVLYIIFG